ncbi:MAG: alpha/beta hydrolase family protein [Terriglobia bacterium]
MNRKQTGATASPRSLPSRSYAEEMPDMLVSYLSQKMNGLCDAWDRKRSEIRTPGEIEARNRFVRAKFIEMIHGQPEKTPLHPVTVRTLERTGYRIEVIMFESQPDFWVTASLYIPTTGKGPFPSILSPCGHEVTGRATPQYQAAYISMVKNGFVVLADDPIGDGERREYWNPQTHENESGGPPTWEHMVGHPLLLIGEDLVHYRLWDDARALDYLLMRPEVDPKRIGCAGQSSGGLYTSFLSAIDDRIQCAAVHEGATGVRYRLNITPNEPLGIGDIDQHVFPGALYGIDDLDIQLVFAPKPLLSTIENFSPDFDRATSILRNRYQQLGVPEKFKALAANDPHGWTSKLRAANTDWFCRWFYGRPGPETEPEIETIEPEENLYCTPDGSIRCSHQGQTIFSLMLRKQAQLPPERQAPATESELHAYRARIVSEIQKVLRYQHSNQPLEPRTVVVTPRKGYNIEKLEFLSEPGIYIPAWVFVPGNQSGPHEAILYINAAGKEADGKEFGAIEALVLKGHLVVAVDVRGVGSTRPPHLAELSHGQFWQLDDVETVLTYWAWLMDEDLFGMRVRDVVRSVDYTLSRPDVKQEGVKLIGKGSGALWALYAAALDTRIQAVICERGLLSYRSLTSVDRFLTETSVFVRDAMAHFDLPQVAAAIADRPLTILSPIDAMKKPVEMSRACRAYRWTEQVYANLNASHRFRILNGPLDDSLLFARKGQDVSSRG